MDIFYLFWAAQGPKGFGDTVPTETKIEIIEFLIAKGCPRCDTPKDTSTSAGAAKAGDLDLLKWLKEKGFIISSSCGRLAARNGHIQVAEWVLNEHITSETLYDMLEGSIEHKQLETFQALLTRYHKNTDGIWPPTSSIANHAARCGALEILQWFVKYEPTVVLDETTWMAAARGCCVEVFAWLESVGVRLSASSLRLGVAHPNSQRYKDCVKWLQEHGIALM